MELTLNSALMGVEISGIRRFTALARSTPGACLLTMRLWPTSLAAIRHRPWPIT